MKLLGIDYGRRRIGIAVTDPSGTCIRGCPTLIRKNNTDLFVQLISTISQHQPERILVGLPLGPHDEDTAMSKEIRNFAKTLGKRLEPKIEIYFVDESFSSQTAVSHLLWRKKKQRRDKEMIDRIAACTIIETFQRLNSCDNRCSGLDL